MIVVVSVSARRCTCFCIGQKHDRKQFESRMKKLKSSILLILIWIGTLTMCFCLILEDFAFPKSMKQYYTWIHGKFYIDILFINDKH